MPQPAILQTRAALFSPPLIAIFVALAIGAPNEYSSEARRFEKAMREDDRDVRVRAIGRFARVADARVVTELIEHAAKRLEHTRELDLREARLIAELDQIERRAAHARTRRNAATSPARAAAAASRERDLRRELADLRTERDGHHHTKRHLILQTAAALDVLDDETQTEALARLDRAANNRREPMKALVAIDVLGHTKLDAACATLSELATSDRTEIRSAAVRACERRAANGTGTDTLDATIRKALDDEDWTIRAAAIEAIAKRPAPASIEVLTEVANREQGRLAEDAAAALQAHPLRRATHRYGASFYGISTCSRRIVFVLDTSGSMDERAATGDLSKLEVAKRELIRTLNELESPALFNLVFFGDVVTAWRPALVALDSKSRADAVAFTEAAKAAGGTNLSGALRAAFASGRDDEPGGGVDTIFVLSDGKPSRGDRLDPEEILQDIAHRHPERRVRIHTIGLGHEHNADLMKGLAGHTGGRYIVRR